MNNLRIGLLSKFMIKKKVDFTDGGGDKSMGKRLGKGLRPKPIPRDDPYHTAEYGSKLRNSRNLKNSESQTEHLK